MKQVYRVEDYFDVEKSVVDAAKEHYNNGNYDMAIKLYKSLLNTNASTKLYFDLGLCYYKIEDYDSAISYLKNSTNLDDTNSTAFSYLGNCYFKKLDANNAIECWMRAKTLTPKDEVVCKNLAISYFAKNMFYESMFYYEEYLKYAQDKSSTNYKSIEKNVKESIESANELYRTAKSNERWKDFVMAERNYLSAIKKYPINSEYSLSLARLYFNMKNFASSATYYELALRESSDKRSIYKSLAQCYENLNNYRLAYCFYDRYAKLVISNQTEYLETIKIMNTMKKYLDSSNGEITLEMAKIHYRNNEYYQARLEYENYAILNPESSVEPEIVNLKSYV